MIGKGMCRAIVAMLAFSILTGAVQAAERLKGTVQEVDKTNSTIMLVIEQGKTLKLQTHPLYLEEVEKGKQIEVLVEDGIVIAIDKAGGAGD